METIKATTNQGDLRLDQLEETISKTGTSFLALGAILGVFHFMGSFAPFQKEANVFTLVYCLFIIYRFIHLSKLKKCITPFELSHHWRQANALSIVNALVNSGIFASIIFFNPDPEQNYYVTLAMIGTLVGGSSLYYYDKKFYRAYSFSNASLPILVFLTEGVQGIILAAISITFYLYINRNVKLQNTFYWKSINNSKFLNQVIEALPTPLSVIDKNLKFVKVNSTLASYNNLDPNDYVGKSLGEYGGFEQSKELILFMEEFLDSPELETNEREVKATVDGKTRYFYFVVSRISNSSNMICISLDLTELKDTQAQLEHQKVMGIEAARMSSIGEMANSMAHEINNPLSIILGKTEQAIRVLGSDKPELSYLNKSLSIISENVKRIANIIHGLRTLSGEIDEGFYDTSVKEVFEQALLLSQERILSSGVQLKIPEVPDFKIHGNPAHLAQVILHVFSNAMEAIKNCDDTWIEVTFKKEESFLDILISDSGQGIPIEISEKIFHPFFSTKGLGQGIGLGLSVSKGIIESHHGEFFVDNTCKNTCFVIRLPEAFEAAA